MSKGKTGKLFQLKEWVTVPEAAKYLSVVLGEEVSESDVLRLGLDGHLKLSVNFVNHARARVGKTIPIEDAKYEDVPSLLKDGTTVRLFRGINIDGKRVLELEDKVVSLGGIWDLPMLGAERLDIEHKYQHLTERPETFFSTAGS